jgi:hypothetical protein
MAAVKKCRIRKSGSQEEDRVEQDFLSLPLSCLPNFLPSSFCL